MQWKSNTDININLPATLNRNDMQELHKNKDKPFVSNINYKDKKNSVQQQQQQRINEQQ